MQESKRKISILIPIEAESGWEDQIVIGEGDYGRWFEVSGALERPDIIFEDKVVLNDLERLIIHMPIR